MHTTTKLMFRIVLTIALAAASAGVLAQGAPPVGAPSPVRVEVFTGAGAMGPGADLGPAVHFGAKRPLLTVAPDSLPGLLRALETGRGFTLSAEALYQRGSEHSGGRWLAGGGLVLRWDVGPESWAVWPHFVVGPAGVYGGVLGGTLEGSPVGVDLSALSGFGLTIPWGESPLTLEVRSLRLLGSGRASGLSFPISMRARL